MASLTNAQMIAGRFAAWARYRKAVRFIQEQASACRTVYIQNSGIAAGIKITPKTKDCVFAKRSGLYVQRGKRLVCVMDRSVVCRITAV